MKNLLNKSITTLKKELDEKNIKEARQFLESEIYSDSFLHELEDYMYVIKKDPNLTEDEKILSKEIMALIMLGLGRNRTIIALKDSKVNRKIFEKVRDSSGINSSDRKKVNEKTLTAMKADANARFKRNAILEKVNWDEIVKGYLEGASPINLGETYKVSPHYIKLKLIDENLFDETRSTLTRKRVAEENLGFVDKDFIVDLVSKNPLDSKDVWWEKTKEKYPWILRHQFYTILIDLNLDRSFDEINAIRNIKSKTQSNDAYMVKLNGYRAAKDVFGSIDNLVDLYMKHSLGSFNKIANKINEEIKFDYKISPRQVSKIITGHSTYRRSKSLGQQQLYKFIKDSFPEYTVLEEQSWDSSKKQVDVYIPDLNVGFEFNGEYWHSNEVLQFNYGKSAKEFHTQRKESVLKKGVKLMFVWENDWNTNYEEVEKAILNKDWDSTILNKCENFVKRSGKYVAPNKKPSLLRKQVIRFLNEKKIHFTKKNNSHLIELTDYNIVVNIPNYNSLSNSKETLNLQKEYESNGIELLTFLPWRNIFKIKEFLTYRLQLSSVTRIPARKCKIISNKGITKEQRKFFEENHLLGYGKFNNIEKTITLEYEGKPVIAGVFLRKDGSKQVELKRLVSTYGVAVQGGASKIIKEYTRQNEIAEEMMTYSDADLGFGGVYSVLGFDVIERSKAQLSWYNENVDMSFSNLSLVRRGADILLKTLPNYEPVGVGEGLPSNQEIVEIYGFIPIYDSGYKKWLMKI